MIWLFVMLSTFGHSHFRARTHFEFPGECAGARNGGRNGGRNGARNGARNEFRAAMTFPACVQAFSRGTGYE